jgi:hypothetical protein
MKAMMIGVVRRRGKAKESGNDYDMCNATLLTPVEPMNNGKMVVEGAGFDTMEMPVEPSALANFLTLKFPASVELVTEARPRRGKVETVIVGLAKAA